MKMNLTSLTKLTAIACMLAFVVVMLGAYTRLSDAGLGCPDWPGCYNHLVMPQSTPELTQAQAAYPAWPIHATKAWTEMTHRYAAGTLALLIACIAFGHFRRSRRTNNSVLVPALLVGLVVFQALLGMWTVTLRLAPLVVMGHLLGGLSILSLLWWLLLSFKTQKAELRLPRQITTARQLRPLLIAGLIILAMQISLGAWTSANYAALICPTFPACTSSQFFPMHNFHDAFNLIAALHAHTAVGRLDQAALITIQMAHRFGAMLTAGFLTFLSVFIILKEKNSTLRHLAIVMICLIIAQICLGVLNVEMLLPIPVAVLHNSVAAMLLMTLISLIYRVFSQPRIFHHIS